MSSRSNRRLVNNLAAICKERDITLYRLGKELGLASSTLWQIAHGQRAATPDVLVALCDKLECQPGDILMVASADETAVAA